MKEHIKQACNEMAQILPQKNKGLSYGPTERFEKEYWEQGYAWHTRDKENTVKYYFEGAAVHRSAVTDQICKRETEGGKSGEGTVWNCYDRALYTHIIKHSVSSADAFRRIFSKPRLYMIECQAAIWIIFYKAILNKYRDAIFNQLFPNLVVSPYLDHMPLFHFVEQHFSDEKAGSNWDSRLEIGVRYYINNWDVSDAGYDAGKTGENVIYCGDGKFFGFPIGLKTRDENVAIINNHRKPGSRISPSFNKTYTKLRGDKIEQAVSRLVRESTTTQEAGGSPAN